MKKRMLLSLVAIACYGCLQIFAQSLDKKFYTTDGPVYVTVQNGDSVYLGGDFTQLGIDKKRLARYKPGSTKPEDNFPVFTQSSVSAIETDGAGGFYLGGNFQDFNGISITQTNLIHVFANGTLDKNFAIVYAYYDGIAALKKVGNRLYIGGNFYYLQNTNLSYLAALNATTGLLDNTWQPDVPDNAVTKIDANDSLVFISGNFNYLGTNPVLNDFASLNAKTGKFIQNFPAFDQPVTGFKIDKNTLYVGGNFNSTGYAQKNIGKASKTDASLITNFPQTDGTVWCTLPDGKGGFYIGGGFGKVGNLNRNNLAHILPNGTVDLKFYVNVSYTVYSLAADSNNLYIGGDFTTVNGAVRNHVASVTKTTGALTNFDPNIDGSVHTIALYKNIIYIGGSFSKIRGIDRANAGAVSISNQLLAWSPSPDNTVNKIVLNSNGTTAFIAGYFLNIKGKSYPYLTKVDAKTGAPARWRPEPDNVVNSIALYQNILYIKGLFYSINGQSRQYFAAVDTSSNKPTALKADINPYYYYYGVGYNDLALDGNKLYIAGNFTSIQDSSRTSIARLDLTTDLIDNWNADESINPNSSLFAVCTDNNNIVFGGSFNFLGTAQRNHLAAIDISNNDFLLKQWKPDVINFYYPYINDIIHYNNTVIAGGYFSYDTSTSGTASYVYSNNLIALDDSTGKINHQFTQYPNSQVNQLGIFNNKLLVNGNFSQIDSIAYYNVVAPRRSLATYDLKNFKLAPDVFDPNNNYYTLSMIIDSSSGNLTFGGNFTLVNTVSRPYLASIDLNTGLPTNWNPAPSGTVQALAIKDNTVFIGGQFYSINNNYQYRQNLAAVDIKTGTELPNWNANTDNLVTTLAIKNNVLYIGGRFNYVNSINRNHAASVNTANGSVLDWNPNPNGYVNCILPVNNWVYLSGSFTSISNGSRQYLARVSGGAAKLGAWNPNPDNLPYSIISAGKNIFVGGSFLNMNLKRHHALVAFDTATTKLTTFDARISGSYPEVTSMALAGANLYLSSSNYTQTIGDSTRGSIAGINTNTAIATAFNPMPNNVFYDNFNNSISIGKNKLCIGGYFSQIASNPSPSYFAVFTLEPQTQASNLSFTNIQTKSATIHFTPGNGEKRLVVIKQGAQPVAPVDGKSYSSNTSFKKGDTTASQSFVVYNGIDNTVTVTGLASNHSYTVSVYEYNGTETATDYLTDSALTGSFQTAATVVSASYINAISKENSQQFTGIYPNPANDKCTVSFTAKNNQDYFIDIIDVKGNIMSHKNIAAAKGLNSIDLNIKDITAGTYIVRITGKNVKQENLKLIKQ